MAADLQTSFVRSKFPPVSPITCINCLFLTLLNKQPNGVDKWLTLNDRRVITIHLHVDCVLNLFVRVVSMVVFVSAVSPLRNVYTATTSWVVVSLLMTVVFNLKVTNFLIWRYLLCLYLLIQSLFQRQSSVFTSIKISRRRKYFYTKKTFL